ncbi:hypothetical protein B0H12DRAFT_1008015 [Mycena haematopus]|nr:hypothetical protein B0H12DRAFT_1008015 [Mycena haematopus]
MDQLIPYKVIVFPTDSRPPFLTEIITSPTQYAVEASPRMPHPEALMEFVAEANTLGVRKPWNYLIIERLQMMGKKFAAPYIVYYPTVSRDGLPFRINSTIRDLQGLNFDRKRPWRGNIIVGKVQDYNHPFESMIDATMADFAIIKNFFVNEAAPSCTYIL